MIYGLVFTIYGLVFSILLLFTIFSKKNNYMVRQKSFRNLILCSLLFSIVEIIGVYFLANGYAFSYFAFFWQLRNIIIFMYAFIFLCYFYILMKEIEYSGFLDLFKNSKVILFCLISFILLPLFYIIFFKIKDMDINNMHYVRGVVAYIILIAGVLFSIISLYSLRKQFKAKRKIIYSIILFMIIFGFACPLQIYFKYISFMPFMTSLFSFILYYNIENPDIELLEDVTKLKDDIEKSNNTKTDFLFNLSYDLINPINTIVSLSDSIISNQNLDEKVIIEDIGSIKLAGNTLLDSIDNIFEMSNDSGNSIKEYSLYELLNRVKSISETRIGAKQVKFEMNIDNNLSSKYIGDINKIQKILLNILGNAVKFTDVGKIIFNINFNVEKNAHILHFKVVDTGCGIKDEEKSFIFADSEDKAGVGLAISKKYIEEMGGSIRFESVYGGGTTFYIDLPQVVSGNKLISEDIGEEVVSNVIEYNDLGKYKVLIVDDDNLDIKVTSRLLEKYNIKAEVCKSTPEFIDKIKNEEVYDLVFLDHKMSDIDGVETVKLIRRLEGYKLPYIVSLTANASSGARDYYKSVGFDDYLSKPIDVYELNKILKKYLKNR